MKKISDLNTESKALATKAELKAEQFKTVKLQAYHLNYFLDHIFLVMMFLKICLFISQHIIP